MYTIKTHTYINKKFIGDSIPGGEAKMLPTPARPLLGRIPDFPRVEDNGKCYCEPVEE